MRRTITIAVATLCAACGASEGTSTVSERGSAPAEARPEAPPPPATPPPAPTPAQPSSEPTPSAASADPRVLAPCLWYADSAAPPADGPGSLAELDEAVRASRSAPNAVVVGRLRLAARGCPRISAGLALVPPAGDPDEEPAASWTEAEAPTLGPRGDERRTAAWTDGADDGDTACGAPATLVFFRAVHAARGAIERLDVEVLDEDSCTLHGHQLQHGDLDGDGTTEVRVEARAGGVADMSAGADRRHRLWIFDLASVRSQVALTMGLEQAAEEEGYGHRSVRADLALRDLDGDGDRDIVLRVREEASERSFDDTDIEGHRDWRSEAHEYDAPADVYRRAQALDARIPGAR